MWHWILSAESKAILEWLLAMTAMTNNQLSPPTSFHVAFQRLGDLLTKDDARSFASTTMQDVWTAVKDIEKQLQSRKSLRGFHRIQPLLSGIEKYSGVVEVLCQGTPYLPYLWVCHGSISMNLTDCLQGSDQTSFAGS